MGKVFIGDGNDLGVAEIFRYDNADIFREEEFCVYTFFLEVTCNDLCIVVFSP